VSTTRLLILRHGETEWSRDRRFTGTRDVSLTERGRWQAEAMATSLAERSLQSVWTSPLERARTTAEVVAKPHRLELTLSPEFREMAFGAWEGLTRAELAARLPDGARTWETAPHLVTPGGGESLADVAVRVAAGLKALRDASGGATVALVSHAIVIRLIVLAALGLGPDRLWTVDASPAGITEIEYGDAWTTVHRMNTLSHLDATVAAP
jgi:probable phosphoglycerate mutase